jgi:hypothetical protein
MRHVWLFDGRGSSIDVGFLLAYRCLTPFEGGIQQSSKNFTLFFLPITFTHGKFPREVGWNGTEPQCGIYQPRAEWIMNAASYPIGLMRRSIWPINPGLAGTLSGRVRPPFPELTAQQDCLWPFR